MNVGSLDNDVTELGYSVSVIADTLGSIQDIRDFIESLPVKISISYTLTPEQALKSRPLTSSLWIVISKQAADVCAALSQWTEAPILIAEEMPLKSEGLIYQQWYNRMKDKVQLELHNIEPVHFSAANVNARIKENFRDIWVLAASLGGPEAVRVFLENLNPAVPAAFIYVQHIEENFSAMLPSVVGNNADIDVIFCEGSESIQAGKVYVIPSGCYAQIDSQARIVLLPNKQWFKPYTPNINQVIDNVAEFFLDRMGVIMFSGMCDDGAQASLALKKQGMMLWAQQPDDCICSAMPEAVIDHCSVDFIGSSVALAEQMNMRYFP